MTFFREEGTIEGAQLKKETTANTDRQDNKHYREDAFSELPETEKPKEEESVGHPS